MNKAQELDVMIMRAKMKAEEIMAQHNIAWNAKEAQETKEGEDAERIQTTNARIQATST